MKKKMLIVICGIIVLQFLLFFLPSSGNAQADVTCTGSGTPLQAAIDAAGTGDTITVTGPCNENVVIGPGKHVLTLQGINPATIDGPLDTSPTIRSLGREITITGFTITGGLDGIQVIRGGTATINGNIIEGTARFGVNVSGNSNATIINNTIQNNATLANPGGGIHVNENSSARIGVLLTSDTIASPNTIENNFGSGILVARSSTAMIVGNTISNNTEDGVRVVRSSQADISANTIDGNALNGILVSQNSGVNLGSDSGTLPADQPNKTTVVNGIWGINASLGAYVDGRRGNLRGKKKNPANGLSILFGSGSINSTKP
jgi:parallel beta-helix repeat protein